MRSRYWIILIVIIVVAGAVAGSTGTGLIFKTIFPKPLAENQPLAESPTLTIPCSNNSPGSCTTGLDPLANYTDDDLNQAAVMLLTPKPKCDQSYLGGTVADCKLALVTIAALRKQYANYQPKRMRDVIIATLDSYESDVKEQLQDNITQASKKHMDEYEKQTNAALARADAIVGILDKLNPQLGSPTNDIIQGIPTILGPSSTGVTISTDPHGPQSFTAAYCNPGETFTVGAYDFDCVDSQWHLKGGPPQP